MSCTPIPAFLATQCLVVYYSCSKHLSILIGGLSNVLFAALYKYWRFYWSGNNGGLLASRLTGHAVSSFSLETKDSLGQALLTRITDTDVLLRVGSRQEFENRIGGPSDN